MRAFAVSQYEHLYVCRGFEVVSQPCLSPPLSHHGELDAHIESRRFLCGSQFHFNLKA